MRRLIAEIIDPLCHNGKLHAPLLALFLVINALVLVNAVLHDPAKGYDAGDHLHYIKTLAEDRRIPTCADSAQCYIPPLAYMMPAILLSTGKLTLLQAAKAAQLGNVLISAALLYVLLKICRLLLPNSIVLRISVLAMLGILPVYYKTLSLIRGEVYLPLLVSLIAYLVLRIFAVGQTNTANFILLGILIGLAILARQWGLLVLPAILLFIGYVSIKDHAMIPAALRAGLACLIIPALVAGWYYLIMYHRYGSLTAWDRPASHLSLTALPASFYFGLGSGKLFTDPIRPSFSNQFPAIFYSDTWGDYSAYFLVYIKDKVTGDYQTGKDLERLIKSGKPLAANLETNRFTINSYLGRVNLVSLFPSLLLVGGLIAAVLQVSRSIRHGELSISERGSLLFLLIVVCSMAGYFWYLLRYQNQGQGGDLIKATHMLQIFPFLALLSAQLLDRIDTRSHRAWLAIMILLGLIVLHNLPAMVTHYPIFP